jgi:transcription antitermination factor NusG
MTWWVVQTESQREHVVRVLLERRQYEIYFPRIKQRSRIAALFPSYLFVRAVEQFYPVRWTDHVVRLLMSGDHPAALVDDIVANIRKRERNGFVVLPAPSKRLKKGQNIRILNGSFCGHIGLYDGMSSHERARVLLDFLGQKVSVELPDRDLEPLPVVSSVVRQ